MRRAAFRAAPRAARRRQSPADWFEWLLLVLMGVFAWLMPVTMALALHGMIQFASNMWRVILHRGHVTYLAQARALGASLIVALNTDASVKRLGKGEDRPLNPLQDRMAVMAALACVDLVTWFDEDTPLARIIECQPDVLVKGGDWQVDKIVGAREVQTSGGKVVSIPFEYDRSTSALLKKIRSL